MTDIARTSGVAGYPGQGAQRWPAVHARDAALLFRIALERAEGGTCWDAVADEGDRVVDIATVVGRQLGLPVKSVPAETFGAFAPLFMADQPSSSVYTQQMLGWTPTHPSLLDDLRNIKP